MQSNCMRYDARPMEEKGQGYFGNSPRSRESCLYFFPFDHTAKRPTPLSENEWPKEEHARIIGEQG
jgi:hypothetical protein